MSGAHTRTPTPGRIARLARGASAGSGACADRTHPSRGTPSRRLDSLSHISGLRSRAVGIADWLQWQFHSTQRSHSPIICMAQPGRQRPVPGTPLRRKPLSRSASARARRAPRAALKHAPAHFQTRLRGAAGPCGATSRRRPQQGHGSMLLDVVSMLLAHLGSPLFGGHRRRRRWGHEAQGNVPRSAADATRGPSHGCGQLGGLHTRCAALRWWRGVATRLQHFPGCCQEHRSSTFTAWRLS